MTATPQPSAASVSSVESTNRPGKAAVIGGWVLSVIPCLLLLFSATMKLLPQEGTDPNLEALGWTSDQLLAIGVLELLCTILYLIPRTSILGGILLAGYLGGAMATHWRVHQLPLVPIPFLLGVVLWLGLYLREPRLRALLPWKR